MFQKRFHVALVRPFPTLQFQPSDAGVVIHVHDAGEAYEVEFMTPDGSIIGVEALRADDLCVASNAARTF